MVRAPAARARRARVDGLCFRFGAALLRRRRRILRGADYRDGPGDLSLHTISDSGYVGGIVARGGILFFSGWIRAKNAVALGMLGIGRRGGVERTDKRADRPRVYRSDYFVVSSGLKRL